MISEELVGKKIRIIDLNLVGTVVYYDRGHYGIKPYIKGTWGYNIINDDNIIEILS